MVFSSSSHRSAFFVHWPFREVVERRTYTVTGQKASAEEIDRLIETGESETIFAKAILEQGRGHVRSQAPLHPHVAAHGTHFPCGRSVFWTPVKVAPWMLQC